MNLLVLGSGAREHALAWRLSREPGVTTVFCAPGNPGTAAIGPSLPVDVADPAAVAELATGHRIDLTIVGPELPLARGVVDHFESLALPVVGPSRAAAALECSKVFAKAFMDRHRVPTAAHIVCTTEAEALDVLASGRFDAPVVVKADGLAAGKGVVVAPTMEGAREAVRAMMGERRFGEAGARVVIEECLQGPELSFFVLCDGERAVPLGSAQDHKRAFDNDQGPNTGGMGAFAPSPLCDAAMEARILREVVDPVLAGMRDEGHPYRGFLYCGLMLTADGPKVIEFNVRFGDPEAQVVLPLLEGDLVGALQAAAAGDLRGRHVSLAPRAAVGVVLASGGYPDAFETGKPIEGSRTPSALEGVTVFHAGTSMKDGRLVTSGGRVLTVVGEGDTHADAQARAYEGVDRIRFEGMHVRRDIASSVVRGGSRAVSYKLKAASRKQERERRTYVGQAFRPAARLPSPSQGIGPTPHAVIRRRKSRDNISARKVVALEEERLAPHAGERVREAVAVVQPGRMSTLSKPAERPAGRVCLVGIDRHDLRLGLR
jgi:phosphoribosylamine---glycine ligase